MSKNNKRATASQDDVDKGTAVFCVPDRRSKIYDLGFPLPADAVVVADMEVGEEGECIRAGTMVTVIQAEIVDEADVLLGFRYEGGTGVCDLHEVRFTTETGTAE